MKSDIYKEIKLPSDPKFVLDYRDIRDNVKPNFSKIDRIIEIKDISKYLSKEGTLLKVRHEGVIFPTLAFGNSRKEKLIVSFSSGDRSKAKDGNLFIRWKYHRCFDSIFLCIDSPMDKYYKKLSPSTPSWYYGTENIDFCRIIADYIDKFTKELNIDLADVTLIGSSAGGYAACRIGSLLNGCKVIAISPQLVISNWHEYEQFSNETGLRIENDSRNNIISDLTRSNSKFVITFNWLSKRDRQFQLLPLLNSLNVNINKCSGLNLASDNILIWVHESEGKSLHSAGIGKLEILFLYHLLCHSADFEASEYECFFKFYNELLNDRGVLEKELFNLKDKQTLNNDKKSLQKPTLKGLYVNKKYEDVIGAAGIDLENLFYAGMSSYRLKKYADAKAFFNLLSILDKKREFYKSSLLGFVSLRERKFSEAVKYFFEDWSVNKDYTNTRNYIAAKLLTKQNLDSSELSICNSFSDKNLNLFLDILNIVYQYLSDELTRSFVANWALNFQYNVSCSMEGRQKDELYVLIHPLISGRSLFGNREFDCDVIFIEQKLVYSYFMIFTEDLLKHITAKIDKHKYKKITVLSSSAGAFFGILLSSYLAKNLCSVKVDCYAFSPQTLIIENYNIDKIPHYRELTKCKKFKFIGDNIIKYGDLRSCLSDASDNLDVHLYYGDKDKVDVIEASNLVNLNIKNIKNHPIKDFPYHQSIFLFRYAKDRLIEQLPKMYPTAGGDLPIKISVEKLLTIKERDGGSLSDLLPYMR